MKYIVKLRKVEPENEITINAKNEIFKYLGLEEVLTEQIPYTKVFKRIIVENFTTLPTILLTRLSQQYIHGAEIIIKTPEKHFKNSYKLSNAQPLVAYGWCPLNLSDPIPKSLANFKFEFGNREITYQQAIDEKILNNSYYMPNEIWKALDDYSQKRIKYCQKKNQTDFSLAEEWYKLLYKQTKVFNIKMYSPNAKTAYEADAEVEFLHEITNNCRLEKGLQPLNEEQIAFLRKYARAYGVEIPTFQWKINSRKTKHGYTQEPERVLNGMSHTDWEQVIVDQRNVNRGLTYKPGFVRQGLVVKETENDKFIRDAYFQLLWIMKHMGDKALMPGYKRCPVCHKIYREHDGCECGACPPIEIVHADHLLYGISSTYEDYDSTSSAYDSLLEESME